MNNASQTEPEDPRIGESLVQDADCDDYFVKEDGKCKGGWVLKQPNGECGEGYISVDDKCWERWMFKLCNGEFTLVSEPSCWPDFLVFVGVVIPLFTQMESVHRKHLQDYAMVFL